MDAKKTTRWSDDIRDTMSPHRHNLVNDPPWYLNAWPGIKDKLIVCYNPCAVVTQ